MFISSAYSILSNMKQRVNTELISFYAVNLRPVGNMAVCGTHSHLTGNSFHHIISVIIWHRILFRLSDQYRGFIQPDAERIQGKSQPFTGCLHKTFL